MKLIKLCALACLIIINQASAETALAAALAHDNAQAQAQQAPAQTIAECKETPVTDALIDLAIPLNHGPNLPVQGLKMELYPEVDGHITIESEISLQEDEVAHPLVAKILAIIGYQKTECGYFFCSEPKASKSDAATTIVSLKKPYPRTCPHEVQIKLRTLLDTEQVAKYRANIIERMNSSRKEVSKDSIFFNRERIFPALK